MGFTRFKFHPLVAAGVAAAGYQTPTPIQAESIPTVLAGQDVMGLAQTGTGKTAAFSLPILQRLMQGERGHVRALILAPTRELAEQINAAIVSLAKQTRLKSITVYGGVNVNPQVEKLKRGVEIVVACPGRLLDHIQQKTINLSSVEVLVLDEADQMFDMGFLPDIRRILGHLPQKRQTLLFSATMPEEIRRLASDVLTDPVTVKVGSTNPPVTVSHAIYPVSQHLKTPLILELLKHADTESVLVFTRTKHRARRLGEQLEKAGYKAASLQGNLSQNRRQEAMDGFRNGTYQILVATDIAARGIDVSQVSHVINYDIPDTAEAYIHRIGRTGRAARSGDAFTLVTPDDTAMVRTIEKLLKSSLKQCIMEGFDYTIPAPLKDQEFARPPRQQMPGRKTACGKKEGSAAASSPKTAAAKRSGQHPPRNPAGGGQRTAARSPSNAGRGIR